MSKMLFYRPKLSKTSNKKYEDKINTFDEDDDEGEYDLFKHKKHGLSAWRRLHVPSKLSIDLIVGRRQLEKDKDPFSEEKLSSMFRDLDTDNDGLISKNDLREWVRIQQRTMLGGLESTIYDEEIEAFFQAGSSTRIPVLTLSGLSQCFKRHPILAFDWNDPLGHADDPNEIKEKILTQIAVIFARLDTDNDGKVYPRDIRIWRKMVYFGCNENKLIFSLIPDEESGDEDNEDDHVAFENRFVTFPQFHYTLLKNFSLYTEMSLQSMFMEVIFSTYYEKLKNIEILPSFDQKKKSRFAKYYTKDEEKLADSYYSPKTGKGRKKAPIATNNTTNTVTSDGIKSSIGGDLEKGYEKKTEGSSRNNYSNHINVNSINDIGDAELIREVKEFLLSDSRIDKDYLAFTCVAKLRLLRVAMSLLEMDRRGGNDDFGEVEDPSASSKKKKGKTRRVSLAKQRSSLTADMFDRLERARGRSRSRSQARSRSRGRYGNDEGGGDNSRERASNMISKMSAEVNNPSSSSSFSSSSSSSSTMATRQRGGGGGVYSSAAASMDQSDIELMMSLIDRQVDGTQKAFMPVNSETINRQQADMMVRAMDHEGKNYVIVDDIQNMLEVLDIKTISRDDLALLIYDAQVLVKAKRSSSVLVGRQESTSKYSSVQLRLSTAQWMSFLNRAGMENIALNLLTCIKRIHAISNTNQEGIRRDSIEHVDLSFLLSPRLKKKSVQEQMALNRQESRTSLSGVTSLRAIMNSKNKSDESGNSEEDVVSEDSLIGASILDHLLEPFQVFMSSDTDEDGFINANDLKKWLLSCHVAQAMINEIEEEIDSLFDPNLPLFGVNSNDDGSLTSAVSSALKSSQSSQSAPVIAQRKYTDEVRTCHKKSPHKDGLNSNLFEKACKRRPNVIILVSTLHYFHMLTNQCKQAMSLDSVELEAINHAASAQFAYYEESTTLKKRIAIVAAEAALKAIEDAEMVQANRFVCIPPSEQDRLGAMYMSLDKLVSATRGVFEEELLGKFSESLLQLRRNIISLRALGTNRSVIALELDMMLRLKQLKYQESVKFAAQLNVLQGSSGSSVKKVKMKEDDENKDTPRKKFNFSGKSKSLFIPETEWICEACTFKNKGIKLACEICNTEMPAPSSGGSATANGRRASGMNIEDFQAATTVHETQPRQLPPLSPMIFTPNRSHQSKSFKEVAKPRGINL